MSFRWYVVFLDCPRALLTVLITKYCIILCERPVCILSFHLLLFLFSFSPIFAVSIDIFHLSHVTAFCAEHHSTNVDGSSGPFRLWRCVTLLRLSSIPAPHTVMLLNCYIGSFHFGSIWLSRILTCHLSAAQLYDPSDTCNMLTLMHPLMQRYAISLHQNAQHFRLFLLSPLATWSSDVPDGVLFPLSPRFLCFAPVRCYIRYSKLPPPPLFFSVVTGGVGILTKLIFETKSKNISPTSFWNENLLNENIPHEGKLTKGKTTV